MKKIVALLLSLVIFLSLGLTSFAIFVPKSAAEINSINASADFQLNTQVGSAYLCEAKTGKVLYAENEFSAASPASSPSDSSSTSKPWPKMTATSSKTSGANTAAISKRVS